MAPYMGALLGMVSEDHNQALGLQSFFFAALRVERHYCLYLSTKTKSFVSLNAGAFGTSAYSGNWELFTDLN